MGRAAVSASAPGPTAIAIVAASVSTRPTMVLPAVRSNSCRAADSVTLNAELDKGNATRGAQTNPFYNTLYLVFTGRFSRGLLSSKSK